MPKTSTKFALKASVLALALSSAPMLANAAGIGKLTVLSALGQPLRAEIELSATKDELSSLAARVASSDQFRQQGIEFSSALSTVQLSIEKRANGQAYVRMTSDKPVNDPFLDVLIELTWASGRLVREYTFLLDPVDLPRPASTLVNTPESAVAPVAQPASPMVVPKAVKSGKASKTVNVEPKVEAAPKAEPAPKPEPAPKSEPAAKAEPKPAAEGGVTREVKRGETLGKIAAETAPDGVSLDQMLVAIFNNNREAFAGDNINRLKTGKILNIPDREAATAASDAEARKTIAVHAQSFNAYRKKLAEAAAGTPVADDAAAQTASGKIAPKVEDKAPAPVGKDKLEVSKSEATKDTKAAKLAEEDKIAREKALKDAQARVAELEKNVSELKKLNELKSQSLAAAEKQAQEAKTKAAEATKPVEPVKVVEAPKVESKPAEAPKVEEKPAEAAKVEPVAEAKPAEVATADKPADAVPPPPPKKQIVIPEPEPEPTFMEENGPLVKLGALLAALVGGFFGYREWKRRQGEASLEQSSQFGPASEASSVFGASGGQSVDTNNVSLGSGFSQTNLTGTEGTAGVDPVAEAEVYMAYGRDPQAEEILLEALKTDPSRQAVHLKLLELYAARKSLKPFEEVARDLKQQTDGTGANWDKAAALGQSIDPSNPLYSGASAAAAVDTGAFDSFGTSTVIMPPGQLAKMAAAGVAEEEPLAATIQLDQPVAFEAPADAAPPVMDFDLDLGSTPAAAETEAEIAPTTLDFDLDLGAGEVTSNEIDGNTLDLEVPSIAPAPLAAADMVAPVAATEPLDIEFDLGTPASSAAPDQGLSFDLDAPAELSEMTVDIPAPAAISPPVDFSSISLELDAPAAPEFSEAAPSAPAAPVEEDNPEVATKLELAQAYEEMGDKEGMRELLQEVLTEGNASQQELARTKLAEHGF